MRATLDYVIEKFDYYNRLCFEGALPRPELAINARYSSLGRTCTFRQQEQDGTVSEHFRIEISNRMDLPEEEYIDTIVHEMIHYYIGYNHIQDTSPHGRVFLAKMKEITERYGIRISVYFSDDEESAIMREGNGWRYICVLEKEDGTCAVALVIRNKLFACWERTKQLPGVQSVRWYASNRAIFERFPVRVEPAFISLPANKLHHYLTGALELENTGTVIRPKAE